jgi:hypothetical protein
MKNLKTYEGFFDFFKKKKSTDVSLIDIEECLYDISEDDRILSQLNGQINTTHFGSNALDKIFELGRRGLSLDRDHEDFMNDLLFRTEAPKFTIKNNILITEIWYDPSVISNEEVTDIVNECTDKLEIYYCKVTYFIDFSPYSLKEPTEWSSFSGMLENTKNQHKDGFRSIIIKIKPSGKLI